MPVKLLCVLSLLFIFVGCANQVPVAENFSLSTQKKLRAPHHWDVISNDIASETKKALNHDVALRDRAVYIEFSKERNSEFSYALRNFIISDLVNQGVLVSEYKENSVLVTYETQVVKHKVHRKSSALTSLFLVSRSLDEQGRSDDFGSTWRYLTGGPTDSELIVTTSILDNGSYRMRKSDVYYVDGEDIRLFLPAPAQIPVKDLKVVNQ